MWASVYISLKWEYTRHTCVVFYIPMEIMCLTQHSLWKASHWFWPVFFFWTPDNTRLLRHMHDEYTNTHVTHSTCMIYLQICVYIKYTYVIILLPPPKKKPWCKWGYKSRMYCSQCFRIIEAEKSNYGNASCYYAVRFHGPLRNKKIWA